MHTVFLFLLKLIFVNQDVWRQYAFQINQFRRPQITNVNPDFQRNCYSIFVKKQKKVLFFFVV